ncbi:MAG: SET domain-containing protein-lysine N-methyltransferase [Cetobacterium sp.]|uniref:SET domain-containing protein-lysine N-methyltransferase n=1 Tax=Cetobacterium sp. TaxID=2071632 RepID=UPI003F3B2BF8
MDAQTFPCECHPAVNTVGRRINHSCRKMPNVKPFHCVLKVDGEDRTVILFRALKDITIDTQLKFDYGVNRKSFRGEVESLEWLND